MQKERPIDHIVIIPARDRYVVNDESLRRADATQPAFAQPQTKVHVLISREEMLAEAADFMEQRLAHHQACGGEGGDFPSTGQAAGISIHADWESAHDLVGCAPHAESNA